MYCLDTNIIIDIFRGDEKVISKIEDIWGKSIFITSITACELYKGAYGHKNSEDKIKIVNEFIKNVEIVSDEFELNGDLVKIYFEKDLYDIRELFASKDVNFVSFKKSVITDSGIFFNDKRCVANAFCKSWLPKTIDSA